MVMRSIAFYISVLGTSIGCICRFLLEVKMAQKVINFLFLVYIQARVYRLKVARNTQHSEREWDLINGLIWRQGDLGLEILRLGLKHWVLELGLKLISWHLDGILRSRLLHEL